MAKEQSGKGNLTMKNESTYTDEYILSLKNVPVTVAAKYLNKSNTFIYWGLQDGVLPFGTAVHQSKQWTYDINPRLLYNYKHGIEQTPLSILKDMAQTMQEIVSQAAQVCQLVAQMQGSEQKL